MKQITTFVYLSVLFLLGLNILAASAQAIPDYQDRKNMAAAGLAFDRYGEGLEHWKKAFVEYRRYTETGPIIGRLNVGHRFDTTDYQGEVDYWPKIGENWYSYFNAGLSGSELFPKFRGGAEIYRILPKGFEASFGLRYMKFSEDNVTIFTGSIGKYLGNWLLIGRPYFTPQDSGLSSSVTFIARRYFANPETFASITGGFGFSPDERRLIDGQADERLLRSRYLGLIWNYLAKDRFELFGELKATDQQFPFADDDIRIYTFEMGARYRF